MENQHEEEVLDPYSEDEDHKQAPDNANGKSKTYKILILLAKSSNF